MPFDWKNLPQKNFAAVGAAPVNSSYWYNMGQQTPVCPVELFLAKPAVDHGASGHSSGMLESTKFCEAGACAAAGDSRAGEVKKEKEERHESVKRKGLSLRKLFSRNNKVAPSN